MADANRLRSRSRTSAGVVKDKPYDEVVDVSDSEEIPTPSPRNDQPLDNLETEPNISRAKTGMNNNNNSDEEVDNLLEMKPLAGSSTSAKVRTLQSQQPSTSVLADNASEDSEEEEEEEEEEDDTQAGHLEGAYDPVEYEHLAVSAEIKELFQYITRYTPQTIELDHKLKPFIPDFIPAVGDIDAFIKVPRPDNQAETLGLTVLDEPCAKQSDPTVLDLQLRAVSKQASIKTVVVKTLQNAEKQPKEIDNWIKSISDLHKSKPPPNVHYSKTMPDIENLMQEWDPEFEELLKEVGLPSAELDCSLSQYVDIICALLDIPIYKSKVQSLHVLFTLFLEFKNSQHFRHLAENNLMDNVLKPSDGVERLVLQ